MDLKCGYAVSGGVMGGALFGMIVGALVVNASIGYILLLLIAWGLDDSAHDHGRCPPR